MTLEPSSAITEPVILAVQHDAAQAALDLCVPAALLYFQGHFPHSPVLPGVVQTHWAVGFGRRYFHLGAAPVVGVQVKFRQIIVPDETIRLALGFAPDRNRVSFEYSGAQAVRSSGTITFGTM